MPCARGSEPRAKQHRQRQAPSALGRSRARPNASAPWWRNAAEKSRALIRQQPQRCLDRVP